MGGPEEPKATLVQIDIKTLEVMEKEQRHIKDLARALAHFQDMHFAPDLLAILVSLLESHHRFVVDVVKEHGMEVEAHHDA